MRVAFVHPDLGIGGAERLVVDAAVALQDLGHHVEMFTSHHDPLHCFEETRDGTLRVHVHGDWLPRSIAGALFLVFAIIRNLVLAFMLVFWHPAFDVIICDQLSVSIPLLRLRGAKILFYCHFPDKLLTKRENWIKNLYRVPLDWLEETTTAASDRVVVNSKFTASIFAQAFPSIRIRPDVLYPSINFSSYDRSIALAADDVFTAYTTHSKPPSIILSINRFERKKNIPLAIEAFALVLAQQETQKSRQRKDSRWPLQLIVAGGYDERVSENTEHLKELRARAHELGLITATVMPKETVTKAKAAEAIACQVLFLPSFSEAQRSFLLSYASVLVYTPANEHFGIVPVEAMYAQVPVVAVNNGGPTESIVHEQTGLLVNGESQEFASAILRILSGDLDGKMMGQRGRERVKQLYSLEHFGHELDHIVKSLVSTSRYP